MAAKYEFQSEQGRIPMSTFASIIRKIFGATPAEADPVAAPAADVPAPAPDAPAPAPDVPAPAAADAPAVAPAAEAESVDIAKVLDDLNEANPETLDWRVSIVDLLKLLGLDSSLSARKQLASELKYEGDTEDSAALNIWLHKKVIDLVAANGGEVPAELRKT
jgi:hypothetical protein